MNNFRTINISQKYKFFSWAPARTGSTHFTNILEKLGFGCADINLETKKLSNFKLKAEHNHTFIFF